MFIDEELPKHKQPLPFPRSLEGMSVQHMQEYRAEPEAEIKKIDAEIESRQSVRAKAESLFK